jgi:hypothetical protein
MSNVFNPTHTINKDNRERAIKALEMFKARCACMKFIRVPLPDGKGYYEIEESKYNRKYKKHTS